MNRVTPDNPYSLQQDVSRLWHHLLDLSALQCRLFAAEFRRSSASLQKSILLTIAGGVLLMASVALLLAAAAIQLHTGAGFTLPASLSMVAGGALLVTGAALAMAYRLGRHSVKALIGPVRDLELNLRSLTGEAPGRPSNPSSTPHNHSNGAP